MKKKTLALLLALSMVLAMFAGCGTTSTDTSSEESSQTSEAAEEEASEAEAADSTEDSAAAGSISYPVGNGQTYSISVVVDGTLLNYLEDSDPANTDAIQIMREETGINFDYTVYAMLSDSMTLMIASGEWTDVICKIDENYSNGLVVALDEEVIMDLAPYIDEYAPDYAAYVHSDEYFEKSCYDDEGQMGAFYNFSLAGANGYGIRMDWLEEAGITEVPETYDELEEACLAVMSNHPELTRCIPLAGSFIAEGYESELMYGYGINTINYVFYRQEDGKVGYAWTTDAARSYLEMIARWVDEGILDADEMLTGDLANYGNDVYLGLSLIKQGDTSMWSESLLTMGDDENFELAAMNYPVVNEGDSLSVTAMAQSVSPYWSISTTCEDPETLIQAINWMYTDEGTIVMNFGREDKSYTVDEDGTYHYTDLVLNNPNGLVSALALSLYVGFETPKIAMQEASDAKLTMDEQFVAQDYWNTQEKTSSSILYGALTVDETDQISGYADIETYAQEQLMAFAVGATEITDETWENFVSTVESMGIDEIIAVYQEAEDRYDAR